jgi:hypothetical protein
MTTEQIDTISPELVDTLMTASPEQVEDLHRRLSEKLAAKEEERKAQEKFQKEEEKKIKRWERENAKRSTGIDKPRLTRDPSEISEVLEYFADRMHNDLVDAFYYLYPKESADYRRALVHSTLGVLQDISFNIIEKKVHQLEESK